MALYTDPEFEKWFAASVSALQGFFEKLASVSTLTRECYALAEQLSRMPTADHARDAAPEDRSVEDQRLLGLLRPIWHRYRSRIYSARIVDENDIVASFLLEIAKTARGASPQFAPTSFEVRALFHELWGNAAKGEYDKERWKVFQQYLESAGPSKPDRWIPIVCEAHSLIERYVPRGVQEDLLEALTNYIEGAGLPVPWKKKFEPLGPDESVIASKPYGHPGTAAAFEPAQSCDRDALQKLVLAWVQITFGVDNSFTHERANRFFEEACELTQSVEIPIETAMKILLHVYSKPKGEPKQELGGVGVSLLALAESLGLSADAAERDEYERVRNMDPDHFRRRHNLKADAGVASRIDRVPAEKTGLGRPQK